MSLIESLGAMYFFVVSVGGCVAAEFYLSVGYVGVASVFIPTSIMVPSMRHLPVHLR